MTPFEQELSAFWKSVDDGAIADVPQALRDRIAELCNMQGVQALWSSVEAPIDPLMSNLYRRVNPEMSGKAQPLTSKHIFQAMRAAYILGAAKVLSGVLPAEAHATAVSTDGPPFVLPEKAKPTPDVQVKIEANRWDSLSEVWPILQAMASGEWTWGANTRCKYIELRIDTRDGGCLVMDRDRVRISPKQLAKQSHRYMTEPWTDASVFSSNKHEIEKLKALSVTNVLIDVVSGEDGMGHEVYAKSVDDVVQKLTSLGAELEDYQLGIKKPSADFQEEISTIPLADKYDATSELRRTDLGWALFRSNTRIRVLNRFEANFINSTLSVLGKKAQT